MKPAGTPPARPAPAALLRAARAAARRAYAPYSHFRVGAAVCAEDGRIFTGCNVENASFGLTICAERAAIFAAVAAGARRLVAAAVTCLDGDGPPWPCGACRQVLAEFGADDMPVHVAGPRARRPETLRLGDLLPRAFRSDTFTQKPARPRERS